MTFCTKYSRVCFTDCSKFQTLRTGSRPKQGYLFGVLRTQISMFEKNRLVLDLSTAKLITTTEVRRQRACCFQTLRTNLVNTIKMNFGEYQIANRTVWHLVMPTSSFQIKRPPLGKKGAVQRRTLRSIVGWVHPTWAEWSNLVELHCGYSESDMGDAPRNKKESTPNHKGNFAGCSDWNQKALAVLKHSVRRLRRGKRKTFHHHNPALWVECLRSVRPWRRCIRRPQHRGQHRPFPGPCWRDKCGLGHLLHTSCGHRCALVNSMRVNSMRSMLIAGSNQHHSLKPGNSCCMLLSQRCVGNK